MGMIGLNLAAKVIDVHLEHMALANIFGAPDVLQEQILSHNAANVLGEIGDDAILRWRQHHLFAAHHHQVLSEVDRQVADRRRRAQGVRLFVRRKLCPAENRTYASEQFIHAKGLGEIVIGAQIETPHLILVLPTRGNDDDRDRRELAHTMTDGEAIYLRHHDNEQEKIGNARLNLFEGLFAIASSDHIVALELEITRDEAEKLRVIIRR